ncbi:hypothetical protein KAR91_74640 [Candidatus Pacearchaeota archaeon]|nr:hypothetical protein [Candidatus Pacearchaeota archaeon]
MAKNKLSKNFEENMAKREYPACYGKYKATVEEDKIKCGTCWFAHDCKAGKAKKIRKPAKPVVAPAETG